jgi:hypothetical protein
MSQIRRFSANACESSLFQNFLSLTSTDFSHQLLVTQIVMVFLLCHLKYLTRYSTVSTVGVDRRKGNHNIQILQID